MESPKVSASLVASAANILAIRTLVGRANGSGTFQHMQPAGRFYNVVSKVVSMIKISNGSGQGGVFSCAKIPIIEGVIKGGEDVLLLGDKALMRALNGPEPEGVPLPSPHPLEAGLLRHCSR